MLALAVIHVGCGDDDDSDKGSNHKDAGPSKGDGAGRGGSGPVSGAAGSGLPPFGTPPPPVECGSTTCASPATGFGIITACCADESTSTCGTTFGGGMCAAPAETDPRCPPLNLMGFLMLGSCCTPEGMCGFDASMFGMSGCVDLSAAATGQGLPAIPGLAFPPPRACEDSGESDAGVAGDQDGGN
jgi:hypothetical protein